MITEALSIRYILTLFFLKFKILLGKDIEILSREWQMEQTSILQGVFFI